MYNESVATTLKIQSDSFQKKLIESKGYFEPLEVRENIYSAFNSKHELVLCYLVGSVEDGYSIVVYKIFEAFGKSKI